MKKYLSFVLCVLAFSSGYAVAGADNKVQRFQELQQVAKQGEPEAMYQLGILYLIGDGVTKSYQQGIRWVEDAAMLGYPDAQSMAANLRYKEAQENPDTYSKALFWYEAVAVSSHPSAKEAQFIMGSMYKLGQGTDVDYAQSKAWLENSMLGNPKIEQVAAAQLMLGSFYELGQGVEQNTKVAKGWYKKSCKNGYRQACTSYEKLNGK